MELGQIFAILAVGIALAVQRRSGMKLIDRRFNDVNKRIDAHERRQREDSKAFSAQIVDLGKDVATLAGRVDEAAGMLAAALQAVLGVVVTRRAGKDRGSSVMEQAAFAPAGSDED